MTTTHIFPVDLIFSFVGFHTLEIAVQGPLADLDIVLEEGLILADDVVVSASGRPEKG